MSHPLQQGPRGTGVLVDFVPRSAIQPDGSEKPDFILNQEPYRKARILVALKNFGCGSSRETAVWGLKGFGFRALIAPSFGDIFFSNCFKNGVLPIILAEEFVVKLINQLKDQVGAQISVDLKEQTVIGPDGEVYSFKVEPLRKKCLLEGLDDISLTLQFRDSIEKFEENYYQKAPWLRPA